MQAMKNSIKRLWSVNFDLLTGLFFCKSTVFANMVSQITATHEINHEIQVVAVFERVVHVYKESKQTKISLNFKKHESHKD